MRKFLRTQRGITLPDLIATIAISLIIMSAVASVIFASSKSYQWSLVNNQSSQEARTILMLISEELRFASAISAPTTGNESNAITYTVDSQLRKIYLDTSTSTVIFKHNETTVHSFEHVSKITFSRKEDTQITVSITVQQTVNNQTRSINMSTLIVPLNV